MYAMKFPQLTLLFLLTFVVNKAWSANFDEYAYDNRYVEIAAGKNNQKYVEKDLNNLTKDGVLNAETGQQNVINATLHWQFLNGIVAQIAYARENGATNYQGYLQSSGGTLTPYSSITGNKSEQNSLQLGYAFNNHNTNWLFKEIQITPLIHYGQYRWMRELIQYNEAYKFNATGIGINTQFKINNNTLVNAMLVKGKTQVANINVPALKFLGQQSGDYFQKWQIGITQSLAPLSPELSNWRFSLLYEQEKYAHGASPIINSLQAPPNQHSPSSWMVGLQRHF
jgi:hypothetical protein